MAAHLSRNLMPTDRLVRYFSSLGMIMRNGYLLVYPQLTIQIPTQETWKKCSLPILHRDLFTKPHISATFSTFNKFNSLSKVHLKEKRVKVPIIEPELICLTAPGFNWPLLTTGTLAFLLYESVDKTDPAESKRKGLWRMAWYVASETPRPKPRAWGRKRGRRKMLAIFGWDGVYLELWKIGQRKQMIGLWNFGRYTRYNVWLTSTESRFTCFRQIHWHHRFTRV